MIPRNRTYGIGIMQSKTHRIIRQRITTALAQHDIDSLHWAFLGILYENRDGMRAGEIAMELGAKASFVTALFNSLKKKGLVGASRDENDRRAKNIRLTDRGSHFVETTEAYLRIKMADIIRDISTPEFIGYVSVLEKMISNTSQ